MHEEEGTKPVIAVTSLVFIDETAQDRIPGDIVTSLFVEEVDKGKGCTERGEQGMPFSQFLVEFRKCFRG